MSRTVISKHYNRLFTQWPRDILRPEVQFQNLLKSRSLEAPKTDIELNGLLQKVLGSSQRERPQEISEVNALYSLIENRYKRNFPLPENLARPHSDVEYYTNLEKELVNTVDRSWFGKMFNRVKGMIRLT